MPLFEVALVQKPTKKEAEEGAQETLILPPMAIIARDDRAAGFQAVITHKDKLAVDLQRVEVLVRPFA
jgi:hypothetical protein